jgi:hypothetical protein
LVQTPQVFKAEVLKLAYEREFHAAITDDASLVEEAGYPITLVEGNEENIKITTQFDLKIAEFKARVNTQKATAKADYEKKVEDLNKKNSDMKMRLDTFKFDSKTKWEAFKFELNKDMDELGQAINDFMGKDEKKK